MKHGMEIFENCNLLEACEWIAFKQPPMELIRAEARGFKRRRLLPDESKNSLSAMMIGSLPNVTQADKDYSKQIYDAEAKLKLAIYDGNVSVFGEISEHESRQEIKKRPMQDSKRLPKSKIVQITDIPAAMILDIGVNRLRAGDITYTDVYIPFAELKRAFHGNTYIKTAFDGINSRYMTPYMKAMVDVINELKITVANQPLKKKVEAVIANKLKEHGIIPSKTLVSYLATAVRLPESQKGHA